jgi:hypothetical protein
MNTGPTVKPSLFWWREPFKEGGAFAVGSDLVLDFEVDLALAFVLGVASQLVNALHAHTRMRTAARKSICRFAHELYPTSKVRVSDIL